MKGTLHHILIFLIFVMLASQTSARPAEEIFMAATGNAQSGIAADTTRVQVLLDQSRGMLFKPGGGGAEIQRSEQLMRQAEKLSNELHYDRGKGKTLLMSALIWNRKNERGKGFDAAKAALALFKKTGNLQGQADALVIIGQHYTNDADQIGMKISYYKKAADMFLKAGHKDRAATTLSDLGDLQIIDNKFEDAFRNLRTALTLFQSIGYKDIQGTYDLIAYDLLHLGDVNALKYNIMAVRLAEANRDTSMLMCTIYNRTGLSYSFAKNMSKAAEYYTKALNIAYKYKDTAAITQISLSVASALTANNRFEAAIPVINKIKKFKVYQNSPDMQATVVTLFLRGYLRSKNFSAAKFYADQLMKYYGRTDIQPDIYQKVPGGIIAYYQATNQYEKSYPYIEAHRKYCIANNIPGFLNDDEARLFKADSATGKFASAISHYQRYKAVNDSILNERNKKQTALLEVQYDAEKKDRDIRLKANNIQLLTRQAQLQRTSFRQERIIRNWIIAASALLLLVLAVLYNRYRLKQRNNVLLQAQQQEINKKNKDLTDFAGKQTVLLKEKEWLLREIHHRVKNNLQITMSLLNVQSSYLESGIALDAITNSQRRMQAMSLIHTKLYQSEDLAYVDMSSYITDLVRYLKESFVQDEPITFEIEAPPFQLDISQAVPIGLILNEAITNAIKYAFKGRPTGRIRISMTQDDHDYYTLEISDNGFGMPDTVISETHDSLGMSLMRGLTDQIQGEFLINNIDGTTITVRFKDLKLMVKELNLKNSQVAPNI